LASLKRCKSLDRDGSLGPQLKQLNDFISVSIYNDGTESYNIESYNESVTYFGEYLSINANTQMWLDANYFIGSSYYNLNKLDSARKFLELVKEKNYDQPIVYSDLTYLYLKLGFKKPALNVVDEGLRRYSDNFDLQVAELNALSKFQVFDTLEQKSEKFLVAHPDNIEVLLLTAASYEKNKKEDTRIKYFLKSESLYKRILAIDSSNYDANYNLGVLYYNEAVELVNTSNVETNVDELGKILEKSSRLFEQALPHLLSIYDRKNANIKLLQALQAIYYNLNMKTQLLDVNEKIKSLNQ
jgi:tetratricopeptide (TPR) repeat protein